MSPPPIAPQLYHITHVDNLAAIVATGALFSDAAMLARGGPQATIGMGRIKRLQLPVHCHPGDVVGDYVPFYFCPRSIMLYVIYRQNHPDLGYRGGQRPIVHLQADLHSVSQWAAACGRRWAFSLANAGARYTSFHASISDLRRLDWEAISATDFQSSHVKDGKQAEFLVRDSFPWSLVERIGVHSSSIARQVEAILADATTHAPLVSVERSWYY